MRCNVVFIAAPKANVMTYGYKNHHIKSVAVKDLPLFTQPEANRYYITQLKVEMCAHS